MTVILRYVTQDLRRQGRASLTIREHTVHVRARISRSPCQARRINVDWRSAYRVRTSETREARRTQSRAVVRAYLGKPSPFLPIRPSFGDFVRRPGNEIPPHQNRL